ncbi:hypothetical protein DCAR_0415368 [Daucus carota subsp. sativus]|uniref:Thioredoxin domain-containing protein n=1 Tax=Daucus carota subsp. sativus TaxID=79200 RepID=A0A162A8Z6_DAUCS|nr:PREDICTED: protein SCO1 homolog 1, mitochondrial [Daucus carota subsp. sativus]WOG96038.1 hypothetical protein DCAR_0415368 [Daucus carota subsp. sativus]
MATTMSRKLHSFRYICRSLYHHQHTAPSLRRLHGLPSLRPQSPQPFQPDKFVGRIGVQSVSVALHRQLCTSAAAPTANTTGKQVDEEKGSGDGGTGSGDSNQSSGQQAKFFRGSPVSWLSFLLLILTGAGIVFYYDNEKKRHIQVINDNSNAVKQGPSAGQAAIGGPFNLVNHDGKSVTEKDFLGKWTIVYFGFTHCPDICPDELQKLAAAIDKIKKKVGLEIVPLFISVDPERDNVEQVREYVKEFHPNLIGLTGSPDEVKKAARAYRVYYMKTEEEDSDYLVDHSIIMYLMDPNMQFVKFYGKNHDVDSLTDGVIQEIHQYIKARAQ